MDKKSLDELVNLSTFDLAFGLATGAYDEAHKFYALKVIKDREDAVKSVPQQVSQVGDNTSSVKPVKALNYKPKPGTKADKIQKLIDKGVVTAKDIYTSLEKQKVNVYLPEIYRVLAKNGISKH